jgi:hypothetical protein
LHALCCVRVCVRLRAVTLLACSLSLILCARSDRPACHRHHVDGSGRRGGRTALARARRRRRRRRGHRGRGAALEAAPRAGALRHVTCCALALPMLSRACMC